MSLGKKTNVLSWERCYILGSCSGLLLLSHIGCLFIANPVTKKYRILDHSGSKLIPTIPDHKDRAMCVGFAVNRNRTTMRFKIVCILEMQTVYKFEISDGYSWRLSETTITPRSISDLRTRMKPVYLNDTLHWLRNDGSIIAFNPETEQARLIPSRFRLQHNLDMKLLFAANENINRLTLISMTKNRISVYTLLENSKWALAKRVKYISTDKREILSSPDVVAYDGKCLVLRQMKKDNPHIRSVVHVYDMEANCWRGLGAICQYAIVYELYKITPSLFFVEEDDEKQKVVVASNHQHIYLTAVLGAIDTTK
ncbi:unnamed protein product [Arabidopsis arenosa]|uniref:F-box associated beta-propeller type 1 domain-containing protein n=1 Tax=Arabidopsis arenosa TaxID=38785 RepID=A0A8S1ZEJ2_ARAAE|nr:unnamed protein product [Arabidopsis arenosa]